MTAAEPQTYLPQGRSFQKIADLVLLPGNPRIITEPQFISLCASIKRDPRFLFVRMPLVADGPEHQAGRIVYGGNMRVRALQQLYRDRWAPSSAHVEYARSKGYAGDWEPGTAPVEVDDIPAELAHERAIQDNASWGQWQDDQLAEMMYDLQQHDPEFLEVSGFDDKVLEDLLASVGAGGDSEGDDDNGTDHGAVGPDPAARLQVYQNTAIRQLVLYYPKDQYEKILDLLDWLRDHFTAESNTEAVTAALEAYQAEHRDVQGDDDGTAEPG